MPNILFLMADQFVWNAIGRIGHWVDTPNLDCLMAEAVSFNRCYTTAPLCLPARASMLTCQYPRALGIESNEAKGLEPGASTWIQNIRKTHNTALFGKLHVNQWTADLRENIPFVKELGFDVSDEIPGPRTYAKFKSGYYDYLKDRGLLEIYSEDVESRYRNKVYSAQPTPLPVADNCDVYVGKKGLDFLEQYDSERPWFCNISFGGPHEPWDAPIDYLLTYLGRTMPPPLRRPMDIAKHRPQGVWDVLTNGKYDPALNETILNMTQDDVKRIRASYAGKVALIDEQIGHIMDAVKRRGEWENTIVVFTADHGEQNGDYELIFKNTFMESSARIPLMIKPSAEFPERGIRCDTPCDIMDIGPTLLEMIGASPLEGGNGRSLCGVMQDAQAHHKEYIVSQLYGETMLLRNSHKAVFNQSGQVYMLFDLERDPQEHRNLASSPEGRYVQLEMEELMQSIAHRLH